MSKAIQDFVKFNVLGIEDDLISKEDKDALNKLIAQKKFFENELLVKGKTFVLETYSMDNKIRIFNQIKQRQGKNTRITFISSLGYPVQILYAYKKKGQIMLHCLLCWAHKQFDMWLDTLLSEVDIGNITKLEPAGFRECYFMSLYHKIDELEQKINDIKNKYNKIYTERKNELEADYDAELAKYGKIHKEAKAHRYQLTSEEALKKAETYKGIERTKNYWNTRITQEEKDILLKWISQNIYSIRVYGLLGGQSGNALLSEYADVGNIKYRNVQKNDEGEVTSQDSIVAHISFKTLEGAPLDILKKVVSTKKRGDTLFRKNRLNDKNLALFLLSEYHDKGFKAGVRNLYKEIAY